MNYRSVILSILMLFVPGISHSESHHEHILKFVKEIGVGWPEGKCCDAPVHPHWMSYVAFSPDGTMVASDGPATPEDISGDLTLWSFPDGRFIKRLPGGIISTDWKYYSGAHGVREMETGRKLTSLGHIDSPHTGYVFSPDGRHVAIARPTRRRGVHDSHIHVVELASGKQVSAFEKHTAVSLAISPDGVTLASGHWNILTLWNMLTGQPVAVFRGFDRYVEGVSFSKDGKLLAAGTDFGGLQIWDVKRRTRIHSVDIGGGSVSVPEFSPDGRLVAVGIYGTGAVWLIDVESGKIVDHQKVSDLGCGSVAFSPDGRFLITPSTGGLIKWPYDKAGTIRVFEVTAPSRP